MKVAVIVTGISGMMAAYLFSRRHGVAVFELELLELMTVRSKKCRTRQGFWPFTAALDATETLLHCSKGQFKGHETRVQK
jgi:predicted flavoprotein YhiN